LIKIGIGGIAGAGKSALRDMFKDDGAFVVNLDEVAHGFYSNPESDIYARIKAEFESRVAGLINPDKSVDRKKLGELVFADRAALDKLNAIFYEAFRAYIENLISELEKKSRIANNGSGLFVLDAAVLFDSGLDALMDFNVWVGAKKETLVARLAERRKIGEKYAESIVETQLKAYAPFRERADYVIDNDGTLAALKNMYLKLIKEIRENVNKS